MIALGVDYSVNSPAVCLLTPGVARFRCLSKERKRTSDEVRIVSAGVEWIFELVKPPTFSTDQEKFHWTAECMADILPVGVLIDFARIEDYAYSGNNLCKIAEATQTFKTILWRRGIPLIEIKPNTLKKEATGFGNAKKPDMADSFEKIAGFRAMNHLWCKTDESTPASDCVDAFFAAGGATWLK
jgi:hypothetical protein